MQESGAALNMLGIPILTGSYQKFPHVFPYNVDHSAEVCNQMCDFISNWAHLYGTKNKLYNGSDKIFKSCRFI